MRFGICSYQPGVQCIGHFRGEFSFYAVLVQVSETVMPEEDGVIAFLQAGSK